MKAIILAGGKGTRLREVIKDVPKPMAPVAGRPFLEYLVLQLSRWGIRDIILSVGYREEIIKSHFGDGTGLGVGITYSDEDEPLGTGGAIRKAAQLINDNEFIAMNGDSFLDLNYDDFRSFHKEKRAELTLALAAVPDTSRFGRVDRDKEGAVVGFSEKGQGGPGLINGGVYMLKQDAVAHIPEGNISVEHEVFPGLVNHGLYGMEVKGSFIDMGLPQDYLKLAENPGLIYNSVESGAKFIQL